MTDINVPSRFTDPKSSIIEEAAYDVDAGLLKIELKTNSGVAYIYSGVPMSEWIAFFRSRSRGKHYNRYIKRRFECTKVGIDDESAGPLTMDEVAEILQLIRQAQQLGITPEDTIDQPLDAEMLQIQQRRTRRRRTNTRPECPVIDMMDPRWDPYRGLSRFDILRAARAGEFSPWAENLRRLREEQNAKIKRGLQK